MEQFVGIIGRWLMPNTNMNEQPESINVPVEQRNYTNVWDGTPNQIERDRDRERMSVYAFDQQRFYESVPVARNERPVYHTRTGHFNDFPWDGDTEFHRQFRETVRIETLPQSNASQMPIRQISCRVYDRVFNLRWRLQDEDLLPEAVIIFNDSKILELWRQVIAHFQQPMHDDRVDTVAYTAEMNQRRRSAQQYILDTDFGPINYRESRRIRDDEEGIRDDEEVPCFNPQQAVEEVDFI